MSVITLSGTVVLEKPLIINNNEELIVLPGTIIQCDSKVFPTTKETIENTGMIIGAAGSTITMNGTIENPITLEGLLNQTWGGVQICSYNKDTTPSVLEKFTVQEVGQEIYNSLRYGDWAELASTNTNISMNYVQINNAGSIITGDREFNALTLCGVTTSSLNNLKVFNSTDDGIEIFSGNVSGTNWVIEYAGDDALDIDQGAFVSIVNLLLIQEPEKTHLEMGNLQNYLGNSLLIASNVLTNGVIRSILKDNTQVLLSGFIPNSGRPSLYFDYNNWGIEVNDFGVTNQMVCVLTETSP
jgi:hypothetical protein